jgi:type I restriction enzyme R subunit
MDDLDDVPFNQKGGRVKFYEIFGDDYEKILEELHEVLINQ